MKSHYGVQILHYHSAITQQSEMMNMNKTNYIEAVAGNAVSVTAGAYQYDRGIKLRVDGTTALSPPNFHFAIDGMENALTAKSTADSSGRLICRIPDTLLMQTAPIHTYIYIDMATTPAIPCASL